MEVEVDVGSQRMQGFRKCGYQFPDGPGVAINLAPADLRKEGSAFDLLMALELAGCQGQFFA